MSPGYQAATAAERPRTCRRGAQTSRTPPCWRSLTLPVAGGIDSSQDRRPVIASSDSASSIGRTTVGTSQYHRVDRQQVRFGAGHRAPLAEAQSIPAEHPRRYRQRRERPVQDECSLPVAALAKRPSPTIEIQSGAPAEVDTAGTSQQRTPDGDGDDRQHENEKKRETNDLRALHVVRPPVIQSRPRQAAAPAHDGVRLPPRPIRSRSPWPARRRRAQR